MQVKLKRLLFVSAVVLTLTMSAVGQEGHPLTGTWYGDFGMNTSQRNDLTVIMKWDGKETTGFVNPGPNSVPLKVARLDTKLGTPGRGGGGGGQGGGNNGGQPAVAPVPPTFTVHFEVDAKNKAGGMDHFVFDGTLENPVAGNRSIKGTWTCGATKGDFRLRRT